MSVHAHFRLRRSEEFDVSIELDLADGSTTALLGPNGAGKSTVVAALAGLLPIDEGAISIDGRIVDSPSDGVFVTPSQRRVGVVFQGHQLFDHLSVADNIEFGPRSLGQSRAAARDVAKLLMGQFELEDLKERRPSDLSGGQAQRVALARALAIDPALLLLDEPLSALDVTARSRVRQSLSRHLRGFAGPRVLITHDPTDAFLLADQIVVLEEGRVIQAGSGDDIRRHPATPYVAALSGRNLLHGTNNSGALSLEASSQSLQTSDTAASGSVLVSIAPSAIALHREQPHGSPRNTWATTVEAVEPLGDISRVYLGDPLALAADLTPGAVTALDLRPGANIWVSIKATEIDVTPV
ncbi:MAG: ATP-binding cassette domain-containing protein [Acidimicrobiia bacterium]|nr:ATP-binding cassette domain-containing protein [Acidimicrobiia bacterium]